jgi:phage terminase large subunit
LTIAAFLTLVPPVFSGGQPMRQVEFSIPPRHAECLLSGHKHLVLPGGRGSGKSYAAADYCLGRALERKRKIVCGREHQSSIKHSAKSLLEARIEEHGLLDRFAITETSIVVRDNGSEFAFIGLAKNIDNVRSMHDVNLWWLEESQRISQKVLDVLLPTMWSRDCQAIWTYNPQRRDDPVDAYFRGPYPRADAKVIVVTYFDNPHLAGTSLMVEVETLKRSNYPAYEHTYLARYDERGDARVLVNYRMGFAEGEPIDMPPLYALDHGYSNDPTALLKIVPYPGNRLFIADERIVSKRSLDLLPELLGGFLHNADSVVYSDSARPDIIDFLQRHGFPNVIGAPKGKASIMAGVEKLQAFELIIAPHCENFYAECHAYSWPVNPLTGVVISGENPVGGFDHGLDCARYALSDYAPQAKGEEESELEQFMRDRGGVMRLNLWPRRDYNNPFLH